MNEMIAPTAPNISVYVAHCISRRRHLKRRMRQYGRLVNRLILANGLANDLSNNEGIIYGKQYWAAAYLQKVRENCT